MKYEFWYAFDRETTDQQYNPTLWARRVPSDALLPAHIELTRERSLSYRENPQTNLQTIHYGQGEHSGSMDVFRPESIRDDAPVVVYIHGGWWQWFSKEQFSFLAEPFNKNGIAVYMPGYRMAQNWDNDTPMESIVSQMEEAVATVLAEAEEKGSRAVYLAGHSAGGQLVAMLHQTDWNRFGLSESAQQRLKGMFSLAGLFDLRPLVDSFVNDAINMSMASAARVSPLLQPPKQSGRLCPLHLLVPEYDTPEFFRQTKEYQHKLLEAGQLCRFQLINDRDHLDIIEKMVEEDDEAFMYIMQHMV